MVFAKTLALGALFVSSASFASVSGLYQADCFQPSGEAISIQQNLNFGKFNARQVQVIFADAACKSPAYAFDFQGPYTLDEDGSLNLTATSLKLMPLSAGVAASFNESKLCGLSNWSLNKAKDVAGRDCGGNEIPEVGAVSYDILKEVDDGIVLGELTATKDGSSEAKRPEAFSSVVFKAVAK